MDESEKMDEIMLPGFRFHPTDEELVGFYLRRKIQQRPLSIELIKQLDIYKYDPWDLPKLATTGEKEWYFYCPRDRKYRNSARPNRVTGAGFWKATGTDRPIYSSEGSKCIGLKKSLVFYKGRAAKGIKTDWMMHEFRLPSVNDTGPSKRYIDKDKIPANDAWAICRIFKKANSSAQRALSHSWVTPLPETSAITTNTSADLVTPQHVYGSNILSSSHEMPLTTKNCIGSGIQFGDSCSSSHQQPSTIPSFPPLDTSSYKSIFNQPISDQLPIISTFPTIITTSDDHQEPSTCTTIDASSSLLLNMSSSHVFGDFDDKDQYFHNFTLGDGDQDQDQDQDHNMRRNYYINHHHPHPAEEQEWTGRTLVINDSNVGVAAQWETMQSAVGYPFNLPLNYSSSSTNMGAVSDAWKCNFFWDSSPCPSSDLSTSFSTTNKCYT